MRRSVRGARAERSSAATARARTVHAVGPLAALALAALLASGALAAWLGSGYAGYDASWALVWGAQIADGARPSFDAALAPTPHPLANLVAIPLSLLGDGGARASVVVSFLSLALLLAGLVVLGARVLCWQAGAIAALIVLTRGLVAQEVALASVDVPFLALVTWAGAVGAGPVRRDRTILCLLLAAGLLRPEAWLLSAAWCAWCAVRRPRCNRWPLAALAAAAPLAWILFDLAATGDPLHSFAGTRELAAELERRTGLASAVRVLPSAMRQVLGLLPLLAGLLGLSCALLLRPRRAGPPAALAVAGVMAFLATGAAGLPLLSRYLLLPACMLALGAGVGIGLPRLGRAGTTQAALIAVATAIAVLLAASVPATVDDLRAARALAETRGGVDADLRRLVAMPAFRAAAARCPAIRVPTARARPVLLMRRPGDERRIVVGNMADGQQGLLLTYASQFAADAFALGASDDARLQAPPAGARLVARGRFWLAYSAC